MTAKMFKTGEFAKKSGVTQRTLRYYDRLGLLVPSVVGDNGHRQYSELDFAKLQQILTLKFIGLSLVEIKRVLTTDMGEIGKLLVSQKQAVEAKISQLKLVSLALNRAQQSLGSGSAFDVEKFVAVIQAVNMSNQFDWFGKYYSDEDKAKLAERAKDWTIEDQKKAQQAWDQLFADTRANMDKDLSDPRVQELVDRYEELIGSFTQGDPGIRSGLNQAYANIHEAPPEIRQWANSFKDVSEFLNRAKDWRQKK